MRVLGIGSLPLPETKADAPRSPCTRAWRFHRDNRDGIATTYGFWGTWAVRRCRPRAVRRSCLPRHWRARRVRRHVQFLMKVLRRLPKSHSDARRPRRTTLLLAKSRPSHLKHQAAIRAIEFIARGEECGKREPPDSQWRMITKDSFRDVFAVFTLTNSSAPIRRPARPG